MVNFEKLADGLNGISRPPVSTTHQFCQSDFIELRDSRAVPHS